MDAVAGSPYRRSAAGQRGMRGRGKWDFDARLVVQLRTYLVGGLQKILELSKEMGVHGRVSAKHDRSTYLGLGRGRFGRWEKYHVKSRHKCSSVLIDETMAFRVQDGGVGRMPGTAGTSSV